MAYHAQRGGISYDQRWNNTAALTTLTSGGGGILYHHARSEYQESIQPLASLIRNISPMIPLLFHYFIGLAAQASGDIIYSGFDRRLHVNGAFGSKRPVRMRCQLGGDGPSKFHGHAWHRWAALTLFDMFARIAEPNRPSPEMLLLKGQQNILAALSQVSAQIHEVAVAVACVQRQIGSLQFAISTDFAIARRELHAIQASLAANRVELFDALANAILTSSMHAAESLRNDAQAGAIVAALKRRDPHALQQLNDKAAVLTSDIERLPFVSPFLIATPLSGATPDQLFERPWDFAKAVADHVIEFSGLLRHRAHQTDNPSEFSFRRSRQRQVKPEKFAGCVGC